MPAFLQPRFLVILPCQTFPLPTRPSGKRRKTPITPRRSCSWARGPGSGARGWTRAGRVERPDLCRRRGEASPGTPALKHPPPRAPQRWGLEMGAGFACPRRSFQPNPKGSRSVAEEAPPTPVLLLAPPAGFPGLPLLAKLDGACAGVEGDTAAGPIPAALPGPSPHAQPAPRPCS